ncbi:MAG: HAD family hydrolase [Alphaproteobacteria bacterium]|nr:HAD family hydrolase [Alphaproteobacteria bacterium]
MTVARLPSAVLFDWDGTLIDSWGAIHAALVGTQRAFGVEPWNLVETRARLQSLRDHFPVAFGERWREALADYRTRYYANHLEAIAMLDGAEALLDAFAALGVPLAVVSNKLGDGLRAEAAHVGWSARFACLIGSGDAARDKPDPAPAFAALDALGMAASEAVWLVGDSTVDLACAERAGLMPVLVGDDPAAHAAAHAVAGPVVPRLADCHALRDYVAALKGGVEQSARIPI